MKAILADALYGTAEFMAQTSEFFAKIQVISQLHRNQMVLFRGQNGRVDRYLVASDLGWRTLDIAQAYTLRWIVEVAIADLKIQEGWGQATKQPGVDGSRRVLILSLLCDHCLLLHPEQQARVEHRQPL